MRLANLDGQAGLIPALAPLRHGPDLAIRNGNRDYGALAVIVSSSDPGHPAHVRIAIEVVSPRAGPGTSCSSPSRQTSSPARPPRAARHGPD